MSIKITQNHPFSSEGDLRRNYQTNKAGVDKICFIINEIKHDLPYEQVKQLLKPETSAVRLNLNHTVKIKAGTFGEVEKCVVTLVSNSSVETKNELVIKKPTNVSNARMHLIREAFIHQMTKEIPHVAGGAVLIQHEQQLYLFQKRFDKDGHSSTLPQNMSKENAITIMGDIFEGGARLQDLHVIHQDLKPANVFIKDGRSYLADFGGAYLLPPHQQITVDLLKELIPVQSDDLTVKNQPPNESSIKRQQHLNYLNENMVNLTPEDKIYFLLYLQLGERFNLYSTLFVSSVSLQNQISAVLFNIQKKYQSEKFPNSDPVVAHYLFEKYAKVDLIASYEHLQRLALSQMTHQMAASSLAMMSQKMNRYLINNRQDGIFIGRNPVDNPFGLEFIKNDFARSGITEEHFPKLLFKMLDPEQNVTPKESYQEFQAITNSSQYNNQTCFFPPI